jgi:hypothetical protein
MFHIVVVRPRPNAKLGPELLMAHGSLLARESTSGRFLAYGPLLHSPDRKRPATLILAVGDREELAELIASSPYMKAGQADWEILTPEDLGEVDDELGDLLVARAQTLATATAPDTGNEWSGDELRGLRFLPGRGGDLAAALAGRSYEQGAQRIGLALLTAFASGTPTAALVEQTRLCVAALRERGWTGDDLLARELAEAIGDPGGGEEMTSWLRTWPLTPIAVDLEMLASELDGDPRQGSGYVDVTTGDVYPPGVLDYDPPSFLDEDSDDWDPDRVIAFEPESRLGYRDMENFAFTVTDPRLENRLLRALDGRGAFRRFRDELEDLPEEYLERWYVFKDERQYGRARDYLASKGYRPALGVGAV